MDNRFNMIVFVFHYLTDIIPSKIPSKAFTENINYVVSMLISYAKAQRAKHNANGSAESRNIITRSDGIDRAV